MDRIGAEELLREEKKVKINGTRINAEKADQPENKSQVFALGLNPRSSDVIRVLFRF
jgi:hypothetical protein